MDEPIIFWHRINSGDYATKLFDHFLHIKRHHAPYPDQNWSIEWGDAIIKINMESMDDAFDFAEQFIRNETIKRTDEPCL